MADIRVLVAEDSDTVRRHIVAVLATESGIEVVGEAADGKRAIELCLALKPDVITLDMMMPIVSGLAATEYIMAFRPTPIVIVSGSVNRGEVFRTYDALAAGALDVLDKPGAGESIEQWNQKLIETVRVASRVKVITHPRARLRGRSDVDIASPPDAVVSTDGTRVVAIGASTGGPKAIVDLLQTLPARFDAPILVVTHISLAFSAGFVEWLASHSPVPVVMAADDGVVAAPGVYVAPADRHMQLRGGRIRLDDSPLRHSCRPSVDVLFESVARESGANGIGVLLTGMGRDGAYGLLAMRMAGGLTIAQDEASSVIFGMPAEAIRLGAAQHVLAPVAIGALLSSLQLARPRLVPRS